MASPYFMLKILKQKRIARKNQSQARADVQGAMKEVHLHFSGNGDDQKCRVCLKRGIVPIYGSASDLSENIKTFGDITLSEDDHYPKLLCEACHSLLQSAILFRRTAKETDRILRQDSQNGKITKEFNDIESIEDSCGNENGQVLTTECYRCTLCKLNFNSKEEYSTHKNSKQHKNVRVQCSICFGLLTPQLYKRHLARHQSASHLICEVCGKMYRKDNLVRHLQLHNFELPFQCQICPYRGRLLESLKIHMRTHTGVKPFSCDKCQLRFLTRSNLNRHLLTHKKDRPFKCIECERGFYTKRDLDLHFKADHAGIKDFGCKMCGNKYGTRKALMRHELRVHKRDKMAKGRMPLYLQEEYRKQCDET